MWVFCVSVCEVCGHPHTSMYVWWCVYALCVHVPIGNASSASLLVGPGPWSWCSLTSLGVSDPVHYVFLLNLCTTAYRHKNQAHSPFIIKQPKIRLNLNKTLKLSFQLCFKLPNETVAWLAPDEVFKVHMWKLNMVPLKGNWLQSSRRTQSVFIQNIPRTSVAHDKTACSLDAAFHSSCMSAARWLGGMANGPCSPAGAQECKTPCVASTNSQVFFSSSPASLLCLLLAQITAAMKGKEYSSTAIQRLPTSGQKKDFPRFAPAASAGCTLGAQGGFVCQKAKGIEEREWQQLLLLVVDEGGLSYSSTFSQY